MNIRFFTHASFILCLFCLFTLATGCEKEEEIDPRFQFNFSDDEDKPPREVRSKKAPKIVFDTEVKAEERYVKYVQVLKNGQILWKPLDLNDQDITSGTYAVFLVPESKTPFPETSSPPKGWRTTGTFVRIQRPSRSDYQPEGMGTPPVRCTALDGPTCGLPGATPSFNEPSRPSSAAIREQARLENKACRTGCQAQLAYCNQGCGKAERVNGDYQDGWGDACRSRCMREETTCFTHCP